MFPINRNTIIIGIVVLAVILLAAGFVKIPDIQGAIYYPQQGYAVNSTNAVTVSLGMSTGYRGSVADLSPAIIQFHSQADVAALSPYMVGKSGTESLTINGITGTRVVSCGPVDGTTCIAYPVNDWSFKTDTEKQQWTSYVTSGSSNSERSISFPIDQQQTVINPVNNSASGTQNNGVTGNPVIQGSDVSQPSVLPISMENLVILLIILAIIIIVLWKLRIFKF